MGVMGIPMVSKNAATPRFTFSSSVSSSSASCSLDGVAFASSDPGLMMLGGRQSHRAIILAVGGAFLQALHRQVPSSSSNFIK